MKKRMPDARTRLRAQTLLDVLADRITATQAADRLGISRKTWHEWQQRGLEAMLEAMADRPTGRPPKERDSEKESMLKELLERDRKIADLEQSRRIQRLLNPPQPRQQAGDTKKKPRRRKKR